MKTLALSFLLALSLFCVTGCGIPYGDGNRALIRGETPPPPPPLGGSGILAGPQGGTGGGGSHCVYITYTSPQVAQCIKNKCGARTSPGFDDCQIACHQRHGSREENVPTSTCIPEDKFKLCLETKCLKKINKRGFRKCMFACYKKHKNNPTPKPPSGGRASQGKLSDGGSGGSAKTPKRDRPAPPPKPCPSPR